MEPEEIAEARDPSIVKPLNLYVESYKKDQQLDAIGRFHQLATLKNTLRRRAGIARSIQQNPDVLNVSPRNSF